MTDFLFDPQLSEGVIARRESQFTMAVLLDGEERAFHCPTTGRMQCHVGELAKSLFDHQRAVLLTCFIYDNPGFKVVERSTNYDEVKCGTADAIRAEAGNLAYRYYYPADDPETVLLVDRWRDQAALDVPGRGLPPGAVVLTPRSSQYSRRCMQSSCMWALLNSVG